MTVIVDENGNTTVSTNNSDSSIVSEKKEDSNEKPIAEITQFRASAEHLYKLRKKRAAANRAAKNASVSQSLGLGKPRTTK